MFLFIRAHLKVYNLKITTNPITTYCQNYNNQTVVRNCHHLQKTILWSKHHAVGKLIMENENQFPFRMILLIMEKALLGKVEFSVIKFGIMNLGKEDCTRLILN